MKKTTRDLKKHYRIVNRKLRDFSLDLTEGSWYNISHTHLDGDGITNTSEKHRKIHILYYIKILDQIEMLTKGYARDFQSWVYLDNHKGEYDAIYFHTQNPYSPFPYKLDNMEINIETPSILAGLLDLSEYTIGKIESVEDNSYCIIIQKKNLGLEIARSKFQMNDKMK